MPSISIANASFEAQNLSNGNWTYGGVGSGKISEWSITSGSGGVYDPTSGQLNNITGSDVAYLYDAGTKISQQASHTYDHNEEITFSVDVGDPDYESSQAYTLNIYAGGTLIGTTSGVTDDTDTLRTVSVTSTVSDHTLNGQPITFEIVKVGQDNEELLVDNVQASYDVVCFTRGVLISTSTGEVAVEDLSVGDKVLTMDNGLQPIRWIGSTIVTELSLSEHPNVRPIQVVAGALGPDTPIQDLVVSPQHRLLVSSPIAERIVGERELLIAAKKLVGLPGVTVVEENEAVEYWHIMLDQHQIIWSNGAPSESFYCGHQSLVTISDEARREVTMLFPELLDPIFTPVRARFFLRNNKMVSELIRRHIKNNKRFCQRKLA